MLREMVIARHARSYAGQEKNLTGWPFLSHDKLKWKMRKSKSFIIIKHVPKAKMIRLDAPPVVGPLMLGMQMAGIDPYPMRKKLIETAKELVK
jgi:hypothetical protein